MKTLVLLLVLSVGVFLSTHAQEDVNIDSLKTEIINEVTILINQSDIESEKILMQLSEQVKEITERNANSISNEAVSEIANSSKIEAVQESNELINSRLEKLLIEVEQMIKQYNGSLNDEIKQLVSESGNNNMDKYEELIHMSEEKMVKRITELIDDKYSEVHLIVAEKIESENQSLMDQVNEHGDNISKLLIKIKELEKKLEEVSGN